MSTFDVNYILLPVVTFVCSYSVILFGSIIHSTKTNPYNNTKMDVIFNMFISGILAIVVLYAYAKGYITYEKGHIILESRRTP